MRWLRGVLQKDHASHELSQALWAGKVRGGDFCSTGLICTKRGLFDQMVRYPFPTALSFFDKRMLNVAGTTPDMSKYEYQGL